MNKLIIIKNIIKIKLLARLLDVCITVIEAKPVEQTFKV